MSSRSRERVTAPGAPGAPGAVAGSLAIARAEWRRLARDRIALVFIVVLPVVVIVIIGATVGASSRSLPVGVVDLDGSPASAQVVGDLAGSGLAQVSPVADLATLREQVRAQTLVGGVVIPEGFGASLRAGGSPRVSVLVDESQSGAPAVLSLVRSSVERSGTPYAAAAFAAAAQGGSFESHLDTARRLAASTPTLDVEVTTVGTRRAASENQFAYTAPSNLVLFVFINALTGGIALVESRRLGVTRRVLAAPVSARTVIAGSAITRLGVALAQSALLVVVGRVVFGVSWGAPLAVLVLVVTFSLVATGAGMLVGAVASSPDQAVAVAVPLGIALGMLGGCMWPLEVVPDTLRALGHLTPHAWAMDAWYGLVFEEQGLDAVVPEVAVLALFAVALLALASWRLQRVLTR